MKIVTTSGNEYWYNPHSNEIEMYEGQTYTLPFVQYLPASPVDSLPDVEHFIIEVTRNCNLRCSYCCYSGKYPEHRVHENSSMSESEIDSLLDFVEVNRNKESKLTISFYGGEPLLNMSFVKTTLALSKERFPEDTEYTISTNGILLSEENIRFAIANDIIMNVSIDGCPTLHDKNRHTSNNQPSFDIVHNNLARVRDNIVYWYSKVRLLVTMESYSDLLQIAEYWATDELLKDVSPFLISLIAPNYSCQGSVEENPTSEILSLLSYYADHRYNLFCKSFFELFTSAIENRQIYEMPGAILPYVCLPNNYKCFIDVNGNIGICEKVSDHLRFGSLRDGIDYDKINTVVTEHASIRKSRCQNCWTYRLCQTCYHNLDMTDEVWEQDCKRNRSLIECKLRIYLELAERGLKQTDFTDLTE